MQNNITSPQQFMPVYNSSLKALPSFTKEVECQM